MANKVELTKLVVTKRTAKASITRCETYISGIDENEFDIDELRVRVERLAEAYSTFNRTQIEIAAIDETISAVDIDAESERIENKYIGLRAKADRLIRAKEHRVLEYNHADRAELEVREVVNGNDRPQRAVNSQVKLPRIELPMFEGAYEEWNAYYNLFNSLIHNENSLSNVQKLHYLKSSLKGGAAEVVASLEILGDNYEDAWARLKERYDNKRLIIQNHVKAIFDLPMAKRENSVLLRQILDGVLKHTRALQAMQRPTQQWDDLLIHVVTNKLDIKSIREWENSVNANQVPSFAELIEFLKKRCQTLEAITKMGNGIETVVRQGSHYKKNACNVATINTKCPQCKGEHNIYQCKEFKGLSVNERIKIIKERGLCLNCLRSGHLAKECVAGNCRTCSKRHNSLLHIDKNKDVSHTKDKNQSMANEEVVESKDIVCNHSCLKELENTSQVLLSTAVIKIKNKDGRLVNVRALLDNGSQSNLVSASLVERLGINTKNTAIEIRGVNQQITKALKVVNLNVNSRFETFKTDLQCIVLSDITQRVPSIKLDKKQMDIPDNVRLADPQFHIPSRIDMLLGAGIFWEILAVGQIKLGKNKPTLQKTLLGWIVTGRIGIPNSNILHTTCHFISTQELNDMLQRFWQVEESPDISKISLDNSYCEKHFKATHSRDSLGRFIIKLPIKENMIKELGNSKDVATKRFSSLERRLDRLPGLKAEYVEFMREYERLEHMRVVESLDVGNRIFLPHQAVVKESSETTKVRVVFDASNRDSKGLSLNDILHKGPVIQQELFSIMMKFRCYRYVISADVTKMYRQIKLHDDHKPLHTILWRERQDEPIRCYELTTLTYGTKPASFIAVRCLHQVADEEKKNFPLAARAVKEDFYMDDLLTGTDNMNELIQLKKQISELLNKGGFELHKWKSNVEGILNDEELRCVEFNDPEGNQESRLLGLKWNSREDTLRFVVQVNNEQSRVSKRIILSEISKLFDPLGLVGPVITLAKILLQNLWVWRIGWDDAVPVNVQNSWLLIKNQLSTLSSIRIPRLMIKVESSGRFALHGFSDASEQAYGACIYLVFQGADKTIKTALVCSKSRVAPLKALSLPRLELSGALLLARLIQRVMIGLKIKISDKYYWTDSQIVLAWISAPARKWHTFVANRVGEIQSLSAPSEWRHVKSKENPADLISRGLTPEQLKHSGIWWEGPSWLRTKMEYPLYNSEVDRSSTILEERKQALVALVVNNNRRIVIEKFSALQRLMRVVAYVLRFIYNVRHEETERRISYISLIELSEARDNLVRIVQKESWPDEVRRLSNKQTVQKTSKLISLAPYMDEHGLIRIGGRLDHSSLSYETKHPIVLPAGCHFTKLVILGQHRKLFHGGFNVTLASVREEYWPINAKNEIKKYLRECVTCRKASPMPSQQLMGQLPEARVNISRPFSKIGIDYCGPISVRDRVRRNSKQYKSYVAVFVCMATKATHIELVDDMTTEAFIGALKRFVARRGTPSEVYSDNGRNFVGAEKELQQLFADPEFKRDVYNAATTKGITWHFIPARAPHFGGLWEAAVKSIKRHLKRTIGNASLTVSETITVLCQIEAILNSRPLVPMSDDPRDLEALTPGHFIIGSSMVSIPHPKLEDIPINKLSRWQYVEQLQQRFWSRWSKEYLTTCQQRFKWKKEKQSGYGVGQLVMLKEDENMPCRWTLARIVKEHPGTDGLVRAVTVRTVKGEYKRPIVKIAPVISE